MGRVDLGQLRQEIMGLRRHQALYKVLKEELSALGYWKNRERGNPAEGYRKGVEKVDKG